MAVNDTSTHADTEITEKREAYVIIYGVLLAFAVFIFIYRTVRFCEFCLAAGTILHNQMVRAVTRTKMLFFHMNSSGRILNRFTRDMGSVDSHLPDVLSDCMDVCLTLPRFILFMLPI